MASEPLHILVKGGKIADIVNYHPVDSASSAANHVIDCRNRTVIPGFIDPHAHLRAYAKRLVTPDLSPRSGIRTISDIQNVIKDQAKDLPKGTWIRASGYDEFGLEEKRHPLSRDIDRIAPHHPVILSHRSGHAHVLSSQAMQQLGITISTGDPPQGLIDRSIPSGEPTGLVFEMGDFLSKRVPPIDDQTLAKGIHLANDHLLSLGVTALQDVSANNDFETREQLSAWKTSACFKPHLFMSIGYAALRSARSSILRSNYQPLAVPIRGVKIILDETTGDLLPSQSEIDVMVAEIHRFGLYAVIHAISEDAVRSACIAISRALKSLPKIRHSHRIEHCALCSPQTAKTIASLGITVVTQPSFIFYNGRRYLQTLKKSELDYLYPIGSLHRHGVNVAFGSDSPVVPPSPLVGIYAAVTRQCESGETIASHEKIPLLDAVTLHTSNAAAAIGIGGSTGLVLPGYRADLAVLSGNMTRMSYDAIRDLQVDMTIVNGEIVWQKNNPGLQPNV